MRRNEVVAAIADDVYIAHVEPGGVTARLAGKLRAWGVPTATESEKPFGGTACEEGIAEAGS
jgi:hypothetical protein